MSRAGALAGVLPVLRGLGLLLHVPAAMAAVSLPVAWLLEEPAGLIALAATAAVAVALGQALFWPCRRGPEMQGHHALVVAALAWLAISAVGALPFRLSGDAAYAGALNAFFESLSGFTTTGVSLTGDPATLPGFLQWWRTLSEWFGAIGVIVVMLAVLPTDRSTLALYRSEARRRKILPTVRSTVRAIWSIYLPYTATAVGLLWLLGEPGWEALNHGMTAIATGGFTVTGDPLAGAGAALKLAYAGIAVVGAVSFLLHYRLIRTGRGLWSGAEIKLFWLILAAGPALIAAENAAASVPVSWLDSGFTWVMAVTTAGFTGADLSAWPAASLLLLTFAVSIGGMAGSTCGGLKLLRLLVLVRAIAWSLAAAARRPHEVMRYVLDGEALTAEDAARRVRAAATLTIGWLLLALLGLFAMLHAVPADTPMDALIFEVFAVQSNTGLSAGAIEPGELGAGGKLVMMLLMWMGRLEIVPVMVLLALAVENGALRRR